MLIIDLCTCTCIQDVQPRAVDPSAALIGVEAITYIGLAVSVIALILTIVTYLVSK